MKIPIIPHILVMIWALVLNALILTLMMLILMTMIRKLLFMLDLWLSVIYRNNASHVKKYNQRINGCSIAIYKAVGLLHSRKRKKKK